MYGQYKNVRIAGIAAAVPDRVVDNMKLIEQFGEKRTKRQMQLTGVKTRHVCDKGQTPSAMACYAAEKLINKLNWDKNDIKALVYVTQFPDVATPSTAMIIQKHLKLSFDCIAFDVNLGCTGYVSGLQIISGLLNNIKGKGLLLTGDGEYCADFSKCTTNSLLFGDAGCATAIEYDEENEGFIYSQKTDGYRYDLLTKSNSGEMFMDGNSITLFSLNEVVNDLKEFKNYFKINEDCIDYYALHQAQKLIVDGIADSCSIDSNKVLVSYDEYGNTYSCTVPVTLCRNTKVYDKEQINILMSGFGVGLAWSNVYMKIDSAAILPLLVTDYKF